MCLLFTNVVMTSSPVGLGEAAEIFKEEAFGHGFPHSG